MATGAMSMPHPPPLPSEMAPVWTSYLSTALSIVSVVASSVLMVSMCRNFERFRVKFPDLLEPLFIMTLADLVNGVVLTTIFVQMSAVPNPDAGSSFLLQCPYLAAASDFAQEFSIAAYVAIGFQLFLAMRGYPLPTIRLWRRRLHFAFCFCSTVTVVVTLGLGRYGWDGADCWIKQPQDFCRLFLYSFVIICVLFSARLLVYVFKTASTWKEMSGTVQRTTAFVGVFFSIWLVPVIDRAWQFITPSPIWLHVVHSAALCSLGTANLCIWYWSPMFGSVEQSATDPSTTASLTYSNSEETMPLYQSDSFHSEGYLSTMRSPSAISVLRPAA